MIILKVTFHPGEKDKNVILVILVQYLYYLWLLTT